MKTGGEKLVLVRSFDELRASMRVVLDPCGQCGKREVLTLLRFVPLARGCYPGEQETCYRAWQCIGGCGNQERQCIPDRAVAEGRVFRFASDLDMERALAAENDNPYLSRSVVGTAGRDETLVTAKERGR